MTQPHDRDDGCGRCFKCREGRGCIRTVSVAPSAMPTRGGGAEAARINRTDAGWHRDMPAYRRLRLDGTQPRRIDGCADLEREATEQFEIDLGLIVPKDQKEKVKEGLAIAQEMDLQVTRPKTVTA